MDVVPASVRGGTSGRATRGTTTSSLSGDTLSMWSPTVSSSSLKLPFFSLGSVARLARSGFSLSPTAARGRQRSPRDWIRVTSSAGTYRWMMLVSGLPTPVLRQDGDGLCPGCCEMPVESQARTLELS